MEDLYCNKCNTIKSEDDFSVNKAKKSGRSSTCRKCHSERERNKRMKHCRICSKNKKLIDNFKITSEVVTSTYLNRTYSSVCNKCIESGKDKKKYTPRPGWIYAVTNPAWKEWVKIGCTAKENPYERVHSYQTGAPLRDYEVHVLAKTTDMISVENYFKAKHGSTHEWHITTIKEVIKELKKIKAITEIIYTQ